jgi:hypothetical protein
MKMKRAPVSSFCGPHKPKGEFAMANMKNGCKERDCIEGGSSTFEKNNYFCGKLMVDRDFRADQLYHSGKQRLHNAWLHGWGTVCGLTVIPHPNCPNLRVVVNPGLAMDCQGREIFVPQPVEVVLESYGRETDGTGAGTEKPENLYICLRYMECETEPVPVFLDECGCSDACAPNRIRETFLIEVFTKEHFGKDELEGYLFDRISSSGETSIVATDKLQALCDGTITIKTLEKTFKSNIIDFGINDTIQLLMDDITSNSAVDTRMEDGRFILTAKNQGDVIILEETGEKPFFSAVKLPAFNTDKGNKIINACPPCSPSHIILAQIKDYKNVDNPGHNFLDPTHSDFKDPAYTMDIFSYRKTLPSVDLLNRLMIYNTFKS